jgi:hypothetical protein
MHGGADGCSEPHCIGQGALGQWPPIERDHNVMEHVFFPLLTSSVA